jgi:hypothetical protein
VKRLAILLLLAACKTTHTVDVREDAKLADVEHAEASGERHDGPWTLTTTTEEYANADVPDRAGDGSSAGVPVLAAGDGKLGRVVKRTIAVEAHGVADESWHSSSDGAVTADTTVTVQAKKETAPAAGCMLGLGFWGAIAIAALLAGAILYLRLRPRL